jgi:L-lactate dehydrogenase complex protein LldF
MNAAGSVLADAARLGAVQKLLRLLEETLGRLPGLLSNWTAVRDLPEIPQQTFRDWWKHREEAANS